LGNKTLLVHAVEALCEIVRLKKEHEMVKQDFDHANAIFLEAVQSGDDMLQFLMELSSMKQQANLSEQAYRRILCQVGSLLRGQVHFSGACLSILDRYKA
jgi:hypothetical protein